MANGAGLAAERALIEGLKKLGFQISTGKRLDEEFKMDGVITAIPMPEQTFFFHQPIALQVTIHPSYWEKRAEFVQVAREAISQLAYMEICGPVSPEMIFMADSALTHLFCCKTAPQTALVTLTSAGYKVTDMDKLLSQYQEWISTLIPGRLTGKMTFWRTEKKYGFLTATVLGPNGMEEEVQFFVYIDSADDALSQKLTACDGEVNITVTFEDGGARSDEKVQKRKTALRVKLA